MNSTDANKVKPTTKQYFLSLAEKSRMVRIYLSIRGVDSPDNPTNIPKRKHKQKPIRKHKQTAKGLN